MSPSVTRALVTARALCTRSAGSDGCMPPQHGSWPRPGQPWLFKYGKTLPLGTHKRRHIQFPHWIVAPLHACFPSCHFHRSILLIIHWPPFADHSRPCKRLNGQRQVAVLRKIGSIWISKRPRWREGRTKSLGRFISSRVVSGMLLGSPFLPTLSAGSRAAIWGALWASPLLRNYLCKPPGKN